jgi:molybdate transport system substrate-binding protein
MAKRWTKKEVIELLDTMSLEELEILWRELRRCWAPTGAVQQLIDRLGISEAIKSKVTIPASDIVSELVAKGELELGVVVITQILTTPGVELVGPLPPEIQSYTVFTAGVSANSKTARAARDLIKFLTGPTAIPVIKSQGMEAAE